MDLNTLWNALDDRLLPLLQDYRARLPSLGVSEKADRTLLTEADLAAQKLIVETIEAAFPGSGFVAEEEMALPRTGLSTWIVDPIDGTSQFVVPDGREFCSVVCRLEGGTPVGVYVLAPELGDGGSPISIHWSDRVLVNGRGAEPLPLRDVPRSASVTRSEGTSARRYERRLAEIGCRMKLRTTSQTLDMVRACIDLSMWTSASANQFDLFYRRRQKVWDGAAGIGLAIATGRLVVDGSGRDQLPLRADFLAESEPTFVDMLVGSPGAVRWFLDELQTGGD